MQAITWLLGNIWQGYFIVTGLLFTRADRSPVFIGKRFNLPERKQVHASTKPVGTIHSGLAGRFNEALDLVDGSCAGWRRHPSIRRQ